MDTFADRLTSARKAAGFATIRELAHASEISEATICRYEGGHRTPRPETVARLAVICRVDTHWLITGQVAA